MTALRRWRPRVTSQAAAAEDRRVHGRRAGGHGAIPGSVGRRNALYEQYSAALREYCANGIEVPLCWDFQPCLLGHRAASEGLGVLEMAAMHQKALVEALLEMVAGDVSSHIAHRASEFLAEALAPFEQRHRRYQ